MPNPFDIFALTTSADLDPARRTGSFRFKVSNNLGRPVEARLSVRPTDPAGKPNDAILPWFDPRELEKTLVPGETDVVEVAVRAPMTAAAGGYAFHLLVATVASPDEEYTDGPTVSFSVAPVPPVPWWRRHWQILVIAATVLLVGGVVAAVLLRHGDPCEGVVCTASGSCREAGACDPATGKCNGSPKPSTTACDDGEACTFGDHCDGAGGCVGTAITCSNDPPPCGAARSCNGTARCAVALPSASTSCDDGKDCTFGDHCDGAGGCVGTTITCSNDPPPCGATRTCNGTAQCAVSFPFGTACNDVNPCTRNDRCNGAGACSGDPYTCSSEGCFQRFCNGDSGCATRVNCPPGFRCCGGDGCIPPLASCP
jgi:hypothetical protein